MIISPHVNHGGVKYLKNGCAVTELYNLLPSVDFQSQMMSTVFSARKLLLHNLVMAHPIVIDDK